MDGNFLPHLLSWGSILLLASFIPLTAFSFYHYRREQKVDEYNRIIEALGYNSENAPAYVPSISKEFGKRDYFLPVGFAFVVAFLGATVLIQGPNLLGNSNISILLDGPSIATGALSADKADTTKLMGMLVIGLSFIGAYIWSAQSLYRRLSTLDLPPSAYYGIGVRILFSIFVSLMVFYLSLDTKTGKVEAPGILAVTVFLAGMFPERALRYLQEKARFLPNKKQDKAHPLPLAMIQGIQLFERVRLAEIGIDNAQNLAKANFIELLLRTPFNPREAIDWIGQARLYLFFTEEIVELRKTGVRTIFDFRKIAQDKALLKEIGQLANIPITKLNIVANITANDVDIARLEYAIFILLGPDPTMHSAQASMRETQNPRISTKQQHIAPNEKKVEPVS